ncbi:MAG TPA: LysR family transcriptional regulator [Polyangiaceae bacterium]|nr:LysR family transcriptional regulator [Polyangiaceae bacterium]
MNETPLDYRLLATFVAVAEQSSFSKAARRLGVGKGTVSRAVARLERILGAELVHRTTHSVALSTAGTALYERAAPHLAALDKAFQGLPERGEDPSGELRMTAPHDFGAIVLPEILAQFSRRYPLVSFDIRLTNARVDLVAERFDLAIRAAPAHMKNSTLTVRRLAITRSEFYAAPTYIARRGRPKLLGEPEHDWILHPSFLALWKVKRQAVKLLCDDFLLVRDLVREGAGVGLLPRFVAHAHVRDGLIENVALGALPNDAWQFVLLYPSSGQVPRKVAAFRDFLLEHGKALARA